MHDFARQRLALLRCGASRSAKGILCPSQDRTPRLSIFAGKSLIRLQLVRDDAAHRQWQTLHFCHIQGMAFFSLTLKKMPPAHAPYLASRGQRPLWTPPSVPFGTVRGAAPPLSNDSNYHCRHYLATPCGASSNDRPPMSCIRNDTRSRFYRRAALFWGLRAPRPRARGYLPWTLIIIPFIGYLLN